MLWLQKYTSSHKSQSNADRSNVNNTSVPTISYTGRTPRSNIENVYSVADPSYKQLSVAATIFCNDMPNIQITFFLEQHSNYLVDHRHIWLTYIIVNSPLCFFSFSSSLLLRKHQSSLAFHPCERSENGETAIATKGDKIITLVVSSQSNLDHLTLVNLK